MQESRVVGEDLKVIERHHLVQTWCHMQAFDERDPKSLRTKQGGVEICVTTNQSSTIVVPVDDLKASSLSSPQSPS